MIIFQEKFDHVPFKKVGSFRMIADEKLNDLLERIKDVEDRIEELEQRVKVLEG